MLLSACNVFSVQLLETSCFQQNGTLLVWAMDRGRKFLMEGVACQMEAAASHASITKFLNRNWFALQQAGHSNLEWLPYSVVDLVPN